MKRIISVIVIAVSAIVFSSCAVAQWRKDVHLSYDQITTDASTKQFLKASKVNQIEILNYLIDQAEKHYLACETIEELYDVKEHLVIIKSLNDQAKQKSTSVTHEIRVLDNKITQTEAEYKGEKVIEATRTEYSTWGQELN